MTSLFKKKYIIPIVASAFLYVGVSFKDDFFEIAKQIEIFTTLFTLMLLVMMYNPNYGVSRFLSKCTRH